MQCTICLENLEETDAQDIEKNKSVLPCGHAFHSKCLVSWLWKNASCPNCRTVNSDSNDPGEAFENFNTHLTELIEQWRQRRNAIQRSIRKSKHPSANPILKRHMKHYEKIKQKIKEVNEERKQIENECKTLEKNARIQRRILYREYLDKFDQFNREHRQECTQLSKNRRRILCILQRSKQIIGWVSKVIRGPKGRATRKNCQNVS